MPSTPCSAWRSSGVFPDLDLVVVFNAAMPYQTADVDLDALVAEFVLPAVKPGT